MGWCFATSLHRSFRTEPLAEQLGTLSTLHTFLDTPGLGRKPGFLGVRKTQKTDFRTHCQAFPKTILDTLGSEAEQAAQAAQLTLPAWGLALILSATWTELQSC